jgi:toxin-antitoxin system PIN domain toxin
MSATLDVNLLVYAADETSDRHNRARALLDWVATTPTITYLFWPVVLGYLRIITHPAVLRSPLTAAEAVADIDGLISRPQIMVAGETDQFWRTFTGVARSMSPAGNLVPDAHLVSLMGDHGVSTIWTNDRDFRKFDGIKVNNPFDDRYSAGFE